MPQKCNTVHKNAKRKTQCVLIVSLVLHCVTFLRHFCLQLTEKRTHCKQQCDKYTCDLRKTLRANRRIVNLVLVVFLFNIVCLLLIVIKVTFCEKKVGFLKKYL